MHTIPQSLLDFLRENPPADFSLSEVMDASLDAAKAV